MLLREDKKSSILEKIEIAKKASSQGRGFIEPNLFQEMLEHGLNDQGVNYVTATEGEIRV